MGKNVLIIEDDIVNMKTSSLILKKHGFNTLKAENGKDALEKLNSNNDLIGVLLDLGLPDLNGLEIIKEIRNHPLHKNCALLVVTINSDKLDCILALEMGANDYITKPFHHRELVARLNASIRRAKNTINTRGPVIRSHDLTIYTEKRLIE